MNQYITLAFLLLFTVQINLTCSDIAYYERIAKALANKQYAEDTPVHMYAHAGLPKQIRKWVKPSFTLDCLMYGVCDINQKSIDKEFTGLHYAARPSLKEPHVNKKRICVYEELLKLGADPTIKNEDGDTPLQSSLKYSDRVHVVQVALLHVRYGVAFTQEDRFKTTRSSHAEPLIRIMDQPMLQALAQQHSILTIMLPVDSIKSLVLEYAGLEHKSS